MIFKDGIKYIFIVTIFLFIGCSNERPVEPIGKWSKVSTQTPGEVLGILELKDSSIFIFTAELEGHSDTKGRYSLSEGRITFEDDSCYSTGTYTYNLSDNKLSFTILSDLCNDRVKVLDGSWTRHSGQ